MHSFFKSDKNHFEVSTGLPGLNIGVTGKEINTTDYQAVRNEIRLSDKRLLADITGLEDKNIVMLEQVHGDRIVHVESCPETNQPFIAEADGLVTRLRGISLVIRTADCVPVFIYDPVAGVLGAVHSGWKGTMLDITGKCIMKMKNDFSCDPAGMHAFILPSIGPGMYEVNTDVSQHFPEDTIVRGEKLYVDLWQNIERSCRREGIPSRNIFNTRVCNRTSSDDFFSHRFGDLGRNLNYAFMDGE